MSLAVMSLNARRQIKRVGRPLVWPGGREGFRAGDLLAPALDYLARRGARFA
jgi:hypothetical protein